tara:strand:+ start:12436 stop:13179 length:744 start_codon:yes stop_codon:yes gene_type:complete
MNNKYINIVEFREYIANMFKKSFHKDDFVVQALSGSFRYTGDIFEGCATNLEFADVYPEAETIKHNKQLYYYFRLNKSILTSFKLNQKEDGTLYCSFFFYRPDDENFLPISDCKLKKIKDSFSFLLKEFFINPEIGAIKDFNSDVFLPSSTLKKNKYVGCYIFKSEGFKNLDFSHNFFFSANKVYEDALYLYSININPEFIEELLSKKDKLRGYNTIIPQVIAKELDINLDRTREETFEILELLYGL